MHFFEQLADCRELLNSQMGLVTEKARHAEDDVKQVKADLTQVVLRKELAPVVETTSRLDKEAERRYLRQKRVTPTLAVRILKYLEQHLKEKHGG